MGKRCASIWNFYEWRKNFVDKYLTIIKLFCQKIHKTKIYQHKWTYKEKCPKPLMRCTKIMSAYIMYIVMEVNK